MAIEAKKSFPRVVIAGISGDSGKTLVSLGILAALKQQGYKTAAFKKGPDFIDPAWLNAACGSPVRNLDTYLIAREKVYRTFTDHALVSGINLIEGNRGLYDGMDAQGSHSTAELAKLLNAPVVLVFDVTKSTRTAAGIVLGMREMDKNLNLAGVILNQVGGERHKKIVTEAVENTTGIPVIGAIPRVAEEILLPSRHLGLVTPAEYSGTNDLITRLGELVGENIDLEKIMDIAEKSDSLECESPKYIEGQKWRGIRVGYFRDSVFTFYYPENLEALEKEGGELVPISSLDEHKLPDIDALYIGGGFPETHAEALAKNRSLMEDVRDRARAGLPIYAECGGLIYLCRSLKIGDSDYPMAAFFDVDLEMNKKPQGHGYSLMEVDTENPFFPVGTLLKGHEFHYTAPSRVGNSLKSAMIVRRGAGFANKRDGLTAHSVWAGYLHLHASGEEIWSRALIRLAKEYKNIKTSSGGGGAQNFHRRAV